MTHVSQIEPLQWRIPPHPGEPAFGYASRLAALNGHDLDALVRGTGVDVRKLHVGEPGAVSDVAALGGIDRSAAETLARCTPHRLGPSDSWIGSERLPWRSLLFGKARYCPHCIAQDLRDGPVDVPPKVRPWLRVEWVVDQVRSCRLHGIRLFETGVDAGSSVIRVRGLPTVLDFANAIGTEVLPRLERSLAEAVPAEAGAFEEWVVRRLGGERDPEAWLDRMPLYAAIDTCEALGNGTLDGGWRPFSLLDATDKAAASLAGYRIAQGAEPAIVRLLDGLVSRGHGAGHLGSEKIYGQIWKALEATLDDPAFDALRGVVRRHALDHVPFPAGSLVLGQVLERRRLHTLTSAAAESRTSRTALRAMFARPSVAPSLPASDRKLLTISVDEFQDRLREFGAALTVNEIKASTGIIHRHVLDLIAEGVIPVLFGSREVARARHRVARVDVDRFMDRLFEGAVPVERPARGQVTLGRACLVASTNIVELVRLILAGRLSWKGCLRGSMRYPDLLVDAGEVLETLRQDNLPRRSMTQLDVRAEMLGMRYQFVVRMVEAGHLTVVREFCPKVRRHLRLITRESFEAFRDRYVTTSELAHGKDMHWRIVQRHLNSVGWKPAYVWDDRGNAIYERTKALDTVMARLPPRRTSRGVSVKRGGRGS